MQCYTLTNLNKIMKGKIDHEGFIESIEGEHIRVKIIQSSACSSCQAKAICSSSESKEKTIDVHTPTPNLYKKGEKVIICASETMGRNAVIFAFLIPLFLLIVWIVSAIKWLGMSELTAIGGVFILLTIYYTVLSFNKKRISKTLSFWIEKT